MGIGMPYAECTEKVNSLCMCVCAVARLFDSRILLASMCMSVKVKNFIACFTCVLTFTHYTHTSIFKVRSMYHKKWVRHACRMCEPCREWVWHRQHGMPTLICVYFFFFFVATTLLLFSIYFITYLIWFLFRCVGDIRYSRLSLPPPPPPPPTRHCASQLLYSVV